MSVEALAIGRRVRVCTCLCRLFKDPLSRAYRKAARQVCRDGITGDDFFSDQEIWAVLVEGQLLFVKDDSMLDLLAQPNNALVRPTRGQVRQFFLSSFPKRRRKKATQAGSRSRQLKSERRAWRNARRRQKLLPKQPRVDRKKSRTSRHTFGKQPPVR